MANIERKNQKIFAKNSPKLGQFGSAINNTRIVSGDVETLQELPAYEEGWSKAVITKKNYPTWQEMDGVQYGLSYQIAYLLQHGMPEWNNKQEYSLNSFCSKKGKIYKSLVEPNIGNDPEQEGSTTWEEFSSGGGQSAFSLFDYKFSDHIIKNLSWLLSTGQNNRKQDYPSMYEAIVNEQITPTTTGVSIKLSTESFTDYDYVLNKVDETFRLPLKVKLASGSAIKGNGKTLGMTNGTTNGGLQTLLFEGYTYTWASSDNYDKPVGSTVQNKVDVYGTVGITEDSSKSGIVTDDKDLYLYFYVGDTVQDADIVNVADIKATKADIDLGNVTVPHLIETYTNGSSGYRIWSDGFCMQFFSVELTLDQNVKVSFLKEMKNLSYKVTGNYNFPPSPLSPSGTPNAVCFSGFNTKYCYAGSRGGNHAIIVIGYLKEGTY